MSCGNGSCGGCGACSVPKIDPALLPPDIDTTYVFSAVGPDEAGNTVHTVTDSNGDVVGTWTTCCGDIDTTISIVDNEDGTWDVVAPDGTVLETIVDTDTTLEIVQTSPTTWDVVDPDGNVVETIEFNDTTLNVVDNGDGTWTVFAPDGSVLTTIVDTDTDTTLDVTMTAPGVWEVTDADGNVVETITFTDTDTFGNITYDATTGEYTWTSADGSTTETWKEGCPCPVDASGTPIPTNADGAPIITNTVHYGVGDSATYDITFADGTVVAAGEPIPAGYTYSGEENVDGSFVSGVGTCCTVDDDFATTFDGTAWVNSDGDTETPPATDVNGDPVDPTLAYIITDGVWAPTGAPSAPVMVNAGAFGTSRPLAATDILLTEGQTADWAVEYPEWPESESYVAAKRSDGKMATPLPSVKCSSESFIYPSWFNWADALQLVQFDDLGFSPGETIWFDTEDIWGTGTRAFEGKLNDDPCGRDMCIQTTVSVDTLSLAAMPGTRAIVGLKIGGAPGFTPLCRVQHQLLDARPTTSYNSPPAYNTAHNLPNDAGEPHIIGFGEVSLSFCDRIAPGQTFYPRVTMFIQYHSTSVSGDEVVTLGSSSMLPVICANYKCETIG